MKFKIVDDIPNHITDAFNLWKGYKNGLITNEDRRKYAYMACLSNLEVLVHINYTRCYKYWTIYLKKKIKI
jgi:hypothetical protein